MSNQLVPRSGSAVTATSNRQLPKRFSKEIAELEGSTAVRIAATQAETIVANEKVQEIKYLAWEAMTGHAMLAGWANHLAGDDPILLDELRFFKDTARLLQGEIIADTVDTFRRI